MLQSQHPRQLLEVSIFLIILDEFQAISRYSAAILWNLGRTKSVFFKESRVGRSAEKMHPLSPFEPKLVDRRKTTQVTLCMGSAFNDEAEEAAAAAAAEVPLEQN